MAEKDKKYYWLKLKRDFFKRHDIQIIEDMPNGKDYILFYVKLLCESVDHDGRLRFNEEIPYNEEMLATISTIYVTSPSPKPRPSNTLISSFSSAREDATFSVALSARPASILVPEAE